MFEMEKDYALAARWLKDSGQLKQQSIGIVAKCARTSGSLSSKEMGQQKSFALANIRTDVSAGVKG